MKKGYFGIGIINPKTEMNVGSLWRSAVIFNAAFIFVIGKRYKRQASDTSNASTKIPLYQYQTFDEFYKSMPHSCQLIGVELDIKSTPLETYHHPSSCIYLLGAEDNGIPPSVRNSCHSLVQIPMGNFNVANAGSIVMYDRYTKNVKKI